mgnify:CR=1 FL=1
MKKFIFLLVTLITLNKTLFAQDDAGTGQQEEIKTVKVWINSFIPRDIPDYTFDSPDGNGTVIPGPHTPLHFTTCFGTDNRDFSSEIHASSRTHSEVEFDVSFSYKFSIS